MPLSIRIARLEDAEAITRVINAAFAIVEGFFIDGERIKLEEVIDSMKRGEFLIAENDNCLVACVYLEPQGERTYLGLLSVDPSRQHSGLGSQLLKEAEEHRARSGSKSMYMKVVNLRTELPDYYRKRGYVETGTSAFPLDIPTKLPCWFIEMSKSLVP